MRTRFLATIALAASASAILGSGCVHATTVRSQHTFEQETLGVVAVATMHDRNPTNVTLCSGALVAPNLILTARHCVSRAITTMPSCDSDGRSHNGAHLGDDADPSHIAIYVGDHVQVDRDIPQAHATKTLHTVGHV